MSSNDLRSNELNRFDLRDSVGEFLKLAIELNIADPLDIYCLATRFGSDLDGMVTELVHWAFCVRLGGSESHSRLCAAADALRVSGFLRPPIC